MHRVKKQIAAIGLTIIMGVVLFAQPCLSAQGKNRAQPNSKLSMSVSLEMGPASYKESAGDNLVAGDVFGFGFGLKFYDWDLRTSLVERSLEVSEPFLGRTGYWDRQQVPLFVSGVDVTLGYRVSILTGIALTPQIGITFQRLKEDVDYHINWDLRSELKYLPLVGLSSEITIPPNRRSNPNVDSFWTFYVRVQTYHVDFSRQDLGKGRVWDVLFGYKFEWGLL